MTTIAGDIDTEPDQEAWYAATCECDAFAISSLGTDGWGQQGITQLAQTHLQRCPVNANSIEITERDADSETVLGVVSR